MPRPPRSVVLGSNETGHPAERLTFSLQSDLQPGQESLWRRPVPGPNTRPPQTPEKRGTRAPGFSQRGPRGHSLTGL